jgi:hypothetical protein
MFTVSLFVKDEPFRDDAEHLTVARSTAGRRPSCRPVPQHEPEAAFVEPQQPVEEALGQPAESRFA